VAEFGQRCVDHTGIAARHAEVQVELALAVPHQDHAPA
jgi:hypothetical protein